MSRTLLSRSGVLVTAAIACLWLGVASTPASEGLPPVAETGDAIAVVAVSDASPTAAAPSIASGVPDSPEDLWQNIERFAAEGDPDAQRFLKQRDLHNVESHAAWLSDLSRYGVYRDTPIAHRGGRTALGWGFAGFGTGAAAFYASSALPGSPLYRGEGGEPMTGVGVMLSSMVLGLGVGFLTVSPGVKAELPNSRRESHQLRLELGLDSDIPWPPPTSDSDNTPVELQAMEGESSARTLWSTPPQNGVEAIQRLGLVKSEAKQVFSRYQLERQLSSLELHIAQTRTYERRANRLGLGAFGLSVASSFALIFVEIPPRGGPPSPTAVGATTAGTLITSSLWGAAFGFGDGQRIEREALERRAAALREELAAFD